jgi:hypothetical protein
MVKIHFRYGSKPLKDFPAEKKVFGGILGGHVYIEINEIFYGFERGEEKSHHIFPRKKYNAEFKKETLEHFNNLEKFNQLISFEIKLNRDQEDKLYSLVEAYHNIVPYDYALFGMRCGASTYHILSQIEFFPKASKLISILLIPYPKLLRKRLFKMAFGYQWEITTQLGCETRRWEKD